MAIYKKFLGRYLSLSILNHRHDLDLRDYLHCTTHRWGVLSVTVWFLGKYRAAKAIARKTDQNVEVIFRLKICIPKLDAKSDSVTNKDILAIATRSPSASFNLDTKNKIGKTNNAKLAKNPAGTPFRTNCPEISEWEPASILVL
jgi:hypothetical protein